jgi:hypothetical protein
MDSLIRSICFALALAVVPAVYLAFCARMRARKVHRLCYQAYFYLFGIAGGFCLALSLSPSGLTGMCIVFLVTIAPLASLIASVRLNACPVRGRFENVAMVMGYLYPGLILTAFIGGPLLS